MSFCYVSLCWKLFLWTYLGQIVIILSVIGLTVTAPCLYSCFLQFLHKSVSVQSNLRLVRLASLKMEMAHFPGGFQFLAHLVKLSHSYFTIWSCYFVPSKHLLHSLIVLSETRKLCFETRKLCFETRKLGSLETRHHIHNTSFSSQLTNRPNTLQCYIAQC